MGDNIHVAIRVRPLINREEKERCEVNWKVASNSLFQVDSNGRSIGIPFVFDRVYDSHESTFNVYADMGQNIAESVIQGFNGTIFAYGQTSSGKTYTMMGGKQSPGLIGLTIDELFELIENTPDRIFLLRVSYLELYNEALADLLCDTKKRPLKVHENRDGEVYVADLKEETVNSPEQILEILRKGEKMRRFGVTNMNEKSSRSHTIFRMIVESRKRDALSKSPDSTDAVTVSQLNFVDLAGSERMSQTGTKGDRFREGCSINLSLLTLSQVISSLSEGQPFINFRSSNLTRILQSSLGGNARTVMICTVTPAEVEQTYSTLKFASRAKTIKNKPQINEILSDEALLKRHNKKIRELTAQLEKEKGAMQSKERLLEEKERRNEVLEEQIRKLKEKLVVSSISPSAGKHSDDLFKQRRVRRETWCGPTLQKKKRMSLAFNLGRDYLEQSYCSPTSVGNLDDDPLLPTFSSPFTSKKDISLNFQGMPSDLVESELQWSERVKLLEMSPIPARIKKHIRWGDETPASSAVKDFPSFIEKERFDKLELEMKNLRNKYEESCVENSKLKDDLQKLEHENTKLEKEYKEIREFTQLEVAIQSQGDDNNSSEEVLGLKTQIKILENSCNSFESLYEKSKQECIKKSAENTEISSRIDCLVKVYEEHEENINKLKHELSTVQKENETIKMAQAEEKNLIEQLRTKNVELSVHYDSDKARYDSRIKELLDQLQEVYNESGTPQKPSDTETAEMEKTIAKLNGQLAREREENRVQVESFTKFIEKLEEEKHVLASQHDAFDDLKSQNDTLRCESETLQCEIAEAHSNLAKFNSNQMQHEKDKAEFESLKTNNCDLMMEHESLKDKFEVLASENNRLADGLRSKHVHVEFTKELMKNKEAALETLKVDFQTLETNNSALIKKVENSEAENGKLTENVAELQSQIKTVKEGSSFVQSENDLLHRQVSELKNGTSKLESLHEERAKLLEEMDLLKSELATVLAEKETLNLRLSDASDKSVQFNDLDKKFKDQFNELQQMKTDLVSAQSNTIDLTNQLQTIESNNTGLENEKKSLLVDLERLNFKVSILQGESECSAENMEESRINVLEEESEDVIKQCVELMVIKDKLEVAQAENYGLQQELCETKAKCAKCELELAQSEKNPALDPQAMVQLKELQSFNSKLETENKALELRCSEVDKLKAKIQQDQSEKKELREKLHEKDDFKLNFDLCRQESEITVNQCVKIAVITTELETAKNENKDLLSKISELQEQCKSRFEQDTSAKFASEQAKISPEQIALLQSEIEAMKNKVESLQKENNIFQMEAQGHDKLQLQLKEAQDECVTFEQTKSKLESTEYELEVMLQQYDELYVEKESLAERMADYQPPAEDGTLNLQSEQLTEMSSMIDALTTDNTRLATHCTELKSINKELQHKFEANDLLVLEYTQKCENLEKELEARSNGQVDDAEELNSLKCKNGDLSAQRSELEDLLENEKEAKQVLEDLLEFNVESLDQLKVEKDEIESCYTEIQAKFAELNDEKLAAEELLKAKEKLHEDLVCLKAEEKRVSEQKILALSESASRQEMEKQTYELNFGDVQTKLTAALQENKEVKSNFESLSGSVSALKTEKESLEASLAGIKATLTTEKDDALAEQKMKMEQEILDYMPLVKSQVEQEVKTKHEGDLNELKANLGADHQKEMDQLSLSHQSKVDSLKSELEAFEKKVESLQQSVKNNQSDFDVNKAAIQDLEGQVKSLGSSLATMTWELEEERAGHRNAVNDLAMAKACILNHETEHGKLEQSLEKAKKDFAERSEAHSKARSQLEEKYDNDIVNLESSIRNTLNNELLEQLRLEKEAENRRFSAEQSKWEAQSTELLAHKSKLALEIEKNASIIAELKDVCNKKERDLRQVSSKLENTESSLSQATEAISSLEQTAQETFTEIQKMAADLKTKSEKLNLKKTEVEALKASLERRTASHDDLEKKLEKNFEILEGLEDKIVTKDRFINQVQRDLKHLQTAKDDASIEIEKVRSNFKTKILDMEVENKIKIEKMEEQMESLRNENNKIGQGEKDQNQVAESSNSNTCAASNEWLRNLETKLKAVLGKTALYSDINSSFYESPKDGVSAFEDLVDKVEDIQDWYEDRFSRARDDAIEHRDKVKDLKKELREYKNKGVESKALDDAFKKIDGLENKCIGQSREISELCVYIRKLKHKLNTKDESEAKNTSENDDIVTKLKNELMAASLQNANLKEGQLKVEEGLNNKIDELKEQAELKEKIISNLKADRAKQHSTGDTCATNDEWLKNLETKLKAVLGKTALYSDINSSFYESPKDGVSVFADLVDKVEDIQDWYEDRFSRARDDAIEHRDKVKDLKKELREYKNKGVESKALDDAFKKMNHMENTSISQRKEIDELHSHIRQLKNKLNIKNETGSNKVDEKDDAIKKLKEELMAASLKTVTLKQELLKTEDLKNNVAALQETVERKEKRINVLKNDLRLKQDLDSTITGKGKPSNISLQVPETFAGGSGIVQDCMIEVYKHKIAKLEREILKYKSGVASKDLPLDENHPVLHSAKRTIVDSPTKSSDRSSLMPPPKKFNTEIESAKKYFNVSDENKREPLRGLRGNKRIATSTTQKEATGLKSRKETDKDDDCKVQ